MDLVLALVVMVVMVVAAAAANFEERLVVGVVVVAAELVLDRPREELVPVDLAVGRRVVRRVEPVELGLGVGERLETVPSGGTYGVRFIVPPRIGTERIGEGLTAPLAP